MEPLSKSQTPGLDDEPAEHSQVEPSAVESQERYPNQEYAEGRLAIGYTQPSQIFVVDEDTALHQNGDIAVVGNGTLLIDGGKLHLTGHLYIAGNGTVIVDGGELHIDGVGTNIYVGESGKLVVRNKSLLHYVQFYVAQHSIVAWGNGRVELRDCSVDCDKSIEFIYMTNDASYEAVNVEYHHWKTWYLWEKASLTLESVNLAGDIVFYDSPTMNFKDTNVIMPWLYFGKSAVVDYQFPAPSPADKPITVTLQDKVQGFSGIPWKLSIDNCRYVAWGVNPYPGSDVTVRNSNLTMVMFRFLGDGTFDLNDLMVAESHYDDVTIPVSDRRFRLIDTMVKWWKVDTFDSFKLNADGIVFSEMVARDGSQVAMRNSICQGQTIHLGAKDDAVIDFRSGEVWSYVSVWDNATMILTDSIVDWKKGKEAHGYIYQTSNIAHGNSRLYCLNSILRERPEAFDNALVLYAFIEPVSQLAIGQSAAIRGSAWIDSGPGNNDVTFSCYQLSWATQNSNEWHLIKKSNKPIDDDVLGIWNTSALTEGKYWLRLKIWINNDASDHPTDEYPVYREVILAAKAP